MIVRQDHRAGVAMQRKLHHDARIDLRAIHAAFRQHLATDDAVMPIEPDGVQLLVEPPREANAQELLRFPRIPQAPAP